MVTAYIIRKERLFQVALVSIFSGLVLCDKPVITALVDR